LHLVNGSVDWDNDKFHPVQGSRWKIVLPEGLAVTRALAFSPDFEKEIPVEINVSRGQAKFTVPGIESYTVISLFSGDSLNEAEKAAKERRTQLKKSMTGWYNSQES
jgi:hypothetical protein